MLTLVVAGAAVLGALVGVLVPRPAYRLSVEYGEPPRSACGTCGTPLGWIGLRGCPHCGARLGPRTWLMGLVGAVSFAALSWALWPSPILPAVLVVAGIGLLVAPIDLAVLRLPDPLVGTAFVAAVVLLGAAAVWTGNYGALLRAILAGAAMAGGYLLLALLPGGQLGLGDVKLVGVLGLPLGWLGWGYVLAGAAVPHLVNAPVILVMLLSGRVRRHSALPLGPALLAGSLLAVVAIVAWRRTQLH